MTISARVASRFVASQLKAMTPVQVAETHGSPRFRGDIGIIQKLIPVGKAYVILKRNKRQLVDVSDLVDISSKRYLLDEGDTTTLKEFIEANEESFHLSELVDVAALPRGETHRDGGGGWAEWSIKAL